MDPLTTFYTMLAICSVLITLGFAAGRAWPKKEKSKPDESGTRRAHDPEFESETRKSLAAILDRLTRIEMSVDGHPTWDQVRALVKESISDHEFHEHKIERRKVGGG